MDCVPLPVLPSGMPASGTPYFTIEFANSFKVTALQYSPWVMKNIYVMGKTSGSGIFKIPGKIGWMTMEAPGAIILLYCMHSIPTGGIASLPLENKTMGGLFVSRNRSLKFQNLIVLLR